MYSMYPTAATGWGTPATPAASYAYPSYNYGTPAAADPWAAYTQQAQQYSYPATTPTNAPGYGPAGGGMGMDAYLPPAPMPEPMSAPGASPMSSPGSTEAAPPFNLQDLLNQAGAQPEPAAAQPQKASLMNPGLIKKALIGLAAAAIAFIGFKKFKGDGNGEESAAFQEGLPASMEYRAKGSENAVALAYNADDTERTNPVFIDTATGTILSADQVEKIDPFDEAFDENVPAAEV